MEKKYALHIFVISPPTYDKFDATTKRKVLSIIASMFDPLGIVSPVVITMSGGMRWCHLIQVSSL